MRNIFFRIHVDLVNFFLSRQTVIYVFCKFFENFSKYRNDPIMRPALFNGQPRVSTKVIYLYFNKRATLFKRPLLKGLNRKLPEEGVRLFKIIIIL